VLYRPGDILPDTADARELVKQKKAVYVDGAGVGDGEEKTPPPPAESDSYESKSVRALELLAKERGIEIPRGTNKAGIVELLKDWAEHAGGGGDEGES
jgi:hypothetical protein